MTALPNSPHDGPDVRSEQASPTGPATSNKAGTDAQAGSLQAPEGSRSMPRWRKSLLGGSMAAATIGLLAAGLVFWANGQSRPDRNAAQTVADAAVHTRRPGEPVKSDASAGSTTPPNAGQSSSAPQASPQQPQEHAVAHAWPEKPVTVIVPFPAGGGTDAFARPLTAELTKRLGKAFIVDNRGGAGGTLGAAIAARAPSDGYTFFLGAVHHAIAPGVYPKLTYDLEKDFYPVAVVAVVPQVIVVNPARVKATTRSSSIKRGPIRAA